MEENITRLPRSTRKDLRSYKPNMLLQNLLRTIHRRQLYAPAAINARAPKDFTFYVDIAMKGEMNLETTVEKDSHQLKEQLEDPADPSEQHYNGPKEKEGKPDWSIFPFDEAQHVLYVFEYGAKKYGAPFTYRKLVPRDYLLAATIRHLIEIQNGCDLDRESCLLHWAHVAANALMALSHWRKVKN
jgi:hypothetical protein